MHSDREQRFWAKVQKAGPDDCWLWTGAKRGQRQKRGCFWNGKRNVDAARWMLESRGHDLDGMVAMHTCDTPLCVNPSHLTVGSQGDNVADMWCKGRANLDGIRAGAEKGRRSLAEKPELRARGKRHGIHQRDLRGSANPQSTLTESDVLEIRKLAGTVSQRKIAAKFNVHQAVVWRIINGKAWAHV